MPEITSLHSLRVALISVLAVICTGAVFSYAKDQYYLQHQNKPPQLNSYVSNACFVVERGVTVLRNRKPSFHIRGMVDPEHAEYNLDTFKNAALALAPNGNASAEFILGWLCAAGFYQLPGVPVEDKLMRPSELHNLGLNFNQCSAAQWYVLSSKHGCSAASIALGNLLDYSDGGDHDKALAIAVKYYKRGIEQGDLEARTHLALSYAYGRGVEVEGERAWKQLEDVIKNGDKQNSTYAIVLAVQAWKDQKIVPPPKFSRGAASAFEFVSQYADTMPGATLDEIYTDPGCVPDAYPQYRWDLATAIRNDWLKQPEGIRIGRVKTTGRKVSLPLKGRTRHRVEDVAKL